MADIAPLGLEFIEIDGEITDATVAEVARAINEPERKARIRPATSRSRGGGSRTRCCAGACDASSGRWEGGVTGG